MSAKQLLLLPACFTILVLWESCATTASTDRIPTLTFTQYGLEPGPSQSQSKSDIDISVKTLRLSDIYGYPNLFSFSLDEFPQWKDNYYLKNNYPPGPLGKRWSYPFASPDASEQLLLNWVRIKNGTKHILRMKDARIYMVVDGQEPFAALSTLDELIQEGARFEAMEKREWDSKVSQMLIKIGDYSYPDGFAGSLITTRRNYYKLINDVSKEILPGFTYEGMLVFPVSPALQGSAKVSFFDVTTKTDPAGNPIEKTQFDFSLQAQRVQMWYDKAESKWKGGTPPPLQVTN